jgi:hypothetical protein
VLLVTDIVLAVIDIALIVLIVSMGVNLGEFFAQDDADAPAREAPAEPEPEPEMDEEPVATAEAEPEAAPAEEPPDEIAPGDREVERLYQVTRGDTFFDLTGRLWEDQHLWPDLYMLNRPDFPNPDFIRPGDTVAVYPSLRADGNLSDRDLEVLLGAYVDTYRRYRSLGRELLQRGREENRPAAVSRGRFYVNKAQWLLYSGTRYARDLLDQYDDRIAPEDARTVRQFISSFGYAPDP